MGQANSVIVEQELLATEALINTSIRSLQSSSSDKAPALVEKYQAVLVNVKKSIADLSGAELDSNKTTELSQAQAIYTSQLANLNIVKNDILEYGDNAYAVLLSKLIIYGICQVFAIIIISHQFLQTKLPFKLLYAFWGAILYPFALAYGIYDTPPWQSILFPLIDTEKDLWANTPFFNIIFYPFSYRRLRPDDTAHTGKTALRIFSVMSLMAFVATFLY